MCINSLLPIWHSFWKLQSWARCSFCVISILCSENSLADRTKADCHYTSGPVSSEWTESLLHQFSCLSRYRYWLIDKIKQYGLTDISISRSVVSNSLQLWTIAGQTSLSMGFSRQEYWSELPFPSPEDLLDPGIEPMFPALQTLYCLSHQSLWGTTHLHVDSGYTPGFFEYMFELGTYLNSFLCTCTLCPHKSFPNTSLYLCSGRFQKTIWILSLKFAHGFPHYNGITIRKTRIAMVFFVCFLLLFFKFLWGIVDLQCCVSFCWIEKRISYTHTHIFSFLDSSPMWLLQNIK